MKTTITSVILLSAIACTPAFADKKDSDETGKRNESNGLPFVLKDDDHGPKEVLVTNTVSVTIEGQPEVTIAGSDPIPVTVENLSEISGNSSSYLGITPEPITGAGGLVARTMLCQANYGQSARVCTDEELISSPDIVKLANDGAAAGITSVWVRPILKSYVYSDYQGSYGFASGTASRQDRMGPAGQCVSDEVVQSYRPLYNFGMALETTTGTGVQARCDIERPVACCN
jgi:hypothetical protein